MDHLTLFNAGIMDEIATHLPPRHLLKCAIVSKDWNLFFIPLLWRTIDLQWGIPINLLLQNQRHVKSLKGFDEFTAVWQKGVTATNRHVNVSASSTIHPDVLSDWASALTHTSVKKGFQILDQLTEAKKLRHLHLLISSYCRGDMAYQVPPLLQRYSNLRGLVMQIQAPISLDLFRQIIFDCRQCEIFHITVCIPYEAPRYSNVKIETYKASIEGLDRVMFRDLSVQAIGPEFDLIGPILKKAHELDSLHLFGRYTLDMLKGVSQILLSHSRPPMKFFGIEYDYILDQQEYWQMIDSLFQGLIKKSISSSLSKMTPMLHFNYPLVMSNQLMRTVEPSLLRNLPLLSNSLTSLSLFRISLQGAIVLWSHLPLLQPAIMQTLTSERLNAQGDVDSICNISWPCVGMKKFTVETSYFINLEESVKRLLDRFFINVGFFKNLEELTIKGDGDSFGGCLHHFDSFKKLYKLDLGGYLVENGTVFSLLDVKFMIEHWRKISLIIVKKSNLKSDISEIIDITQKNNINWSKLE